MKLYCTECFLCITSKPKLIFLVKKYFIVCHYYGLGSSNSKIIFFQSWSRGKMSFFSKLRVKLNFFLPFQYSWHTIWVQKYRRVYFLAPKMASSSHLDLHSHSLLKSKTMFYWFIHATSNSIFNCGEWGWQFATTIL